LETVVDVVVGDELGEGREAVTDAEETPPTDLNVESAPRALRNMEVSVSQY
jgi:hypothetical protein